jgi:hypothetical protein
LFKKSTLICFPFYFKEIYRLILTAVLLWVVRVCAVCRRILPVVHALKIKSQSNVFFFTNYTSVDTEMCCPKGKCGCQYFILLTLKKEIHGHRFLDFFLIKK